MFLLVQTFSAIGICRDVGVEVCRPEGYCLFVALATLTFGCFHVLFSIAIRNFLINSLLSISSTMSSSKKVTNKPMWEKR